MTFAEVDTDCGTVVSVMCAPITSAADIIILQHFSGNSTLQKFSQSLCIATFSF